MVDAVGCETAKKNKNNPCKICRGYFFVVYLSYQIKTTMEQLLIEAFRRDVQKEFNKTLPKHLEGFVRLKIVNEEPNFEPIVFSKN
jgi:hypothetical protein